MNTSTQSIFILFILLSIAAAQQSGYNYDIAPAQIQHNNGFIQSAPVQYQEPVQYQAPGQYQEPVQYQAPVHYQAPAHYQTPAHYQEEFNKEFYSYSAPEEEFAVPEHEHGPSVLKKNLKVLFIRGPEQQGFNRALQNIVQQNADQKTAIYVLTKQPDISQLQNSFQSISNNAAHKPDVHFVKYKTPEDAARAQQSIRAHYDALGGSSLNSAESIAPVLDFTSHQHNNYQHSFGGHGGAAQVPVPSQEYLPSSLLSIL